MPLRVYSLEELPDYSGYDFNGCNIAALGGAKTLFGDLVYRDGAGIGFIEHEIPARLYPGYAKVISRPVA